MIYLWFFFFKQKTAYEMRISDWSSDVCSSDLMPTPATRTRISFPPGSGRSNGSMAKGACAWRRIAALACMSSSLLLEAESGPGGQAFGEIGRAPCRERACQYV